PEAVVDPLAERDVARRGTSEVEAVRIRPTPFISVRRCPDEADVGTLRDGRPEQVDLARRRPDQGLDRRVVPEELLDGRRHRLRFGSEELALVREPCEVEQGVGDQAGCRRDARDEQQHAAADYLLARPLARILGLAYAAEA